MLPYGLYESKPQSIPPIFEMPPAAKGDLEVLVIQSTARPFYIDYERGVMTIPVDPEKVAESVVKDHIGATIHVTNGAKPALFYVKGALTKAEVKLKHKPEIELAINEQNKWFERLIKAADDSWQRARRHNLISDQHRLAARMLGVKREWSEVINPADQVECMYCTTLIAARALVCPICRMPQEAAINALPPAAREVISAALKVPQVKPLG
jgi:hypothetical protein